MKNILLHLCVGASAAVALILVAVAYSDRIDPVSHATLACVGMLFPFCVLANLVVLVLWLFFKWRKAWIPIVALALAFPAIRIYLPLHFQQELPADCIKVLSYNVACYTVKDPCPSPVDTVFAYLKRQDADIVCLQEDAINAKGVLTHYEDLYPYNDTVHVNRHGGRLINAVGLHSRYPILRKEKLPYTSEANGSAAFFLLVGSDTVIVINNHLESTHLSVSDRKEYTTIITGGSNSEETKAGTRKLLGKVSTAMAKRAEQAQVVNQYVSDHSSYPVIVCGDFNDTPISYSRRTVASNLTDCFVETGCGLGISFNKKGFYFRIDQMMCSSHFQPFNCYVDSHVAASDHYPIVCWLKRQ